MSYFGGHVGFRPEKNMCLPTQLGACSHLPGSHMGPYISRTPIRDSRATRRAPAGDYMLRAALEGTHFFLGENRHAPPNDPFWALLQLAKRLCPFKLYRDSVQGGMVDSKSYCTVVKTHRDETSQVTDLSPG